MALSWHPWPQNLHTSAPRTPNPTSHSTSITARSMSGTPPHTAAETLAERIGNGVVRGPFHEGESSPQEIAETIIQTEPFLNGSLTPNRVFPSSPPLPIHTSSEDSNSGILLDPNLSAAPPSSPNSPSENSSIQSEDDMLSSYSGNSRNSAEAGKVKSSTSTSTRTYHTTVEEYDSANSSIIEEVIEEKNEDETIIKTENDDDEITFRQESEDEENDNPCFVPVPCDDGFGFKPYKTIHSAESGVGGQVVHRRVSNGTSRNNEQYKTDNHSDRSTDTDVGGVQLSHQQVDNDGTSRDNSPEPPMQTQDDIIRFVNGSQCSLAKLSERALIEFLRENDLDGPVKRICPYITVNKCMRINDSKEPCKDKTHFYRRTNQVYNVKLGDCSYLSGCYNYDTCPFVHYSTKPAVQPKTVFEAIEDKIPEHLDEAVKKHGNGDMYAGLKEIQAKIKSEEKGKPHAQWINTDISVLPMKVLGKFTAVVVDPPWPIHMKLPYRQMSDQDILALPIKDLQDDGVIFLWVTSRALEKGIECLEKWGYIFTDYITWAKTNQINATIATGRTGHWLNHMKETCLVGLKGKPKLNAGLDSNVIVERIRETSRKPDALYVMIERLVGDGRKLELFGRQHNLRHGWLTLGNQLPGTNILDPWLERRWRHYLWVCKQKGTVPSAPAALSTTEEQPDDTLPIPRAPEGHGELGSYGGGNFGRHNQFQTVGAAPQAAKAASQAAKVTNYNHEHANYGHTQSQATESTRQVAEPASQIARVTNYNNGHAQSRKYFCGGPAQDTGAHEDNIVSRGDQGDLSNRGDRERTPGSNAHNPIIIDSEGNTHVNERVQSLNLDPPGSVYCDSRVRTHSNNSPSGSNPHSTITTMVHSEGNVHANEHLANPVPDFNPQSSAYYDSRVRSQSNNLPSGSMARQEREARIEARIQEALGGPREGEDEVPFPSGRIIREAQLRRSETTVMSPPRRGTDRISRLPRSETDFGLAGRSLSPLRMTQESRVSGFGPGGSVRYHHRRTETQTTIRRSESFHRSDARNPSHRSSSHRSHPEESRSGRSRGRGERN